MVGKYTSKSILFIRVFTGINLFTLEIIVLSFNLIFRSVLIFGKKLKPK